MSEKIKFTDIDTKEEIEFNVIEETRINNVNYLLVTENTGEEIDEENSEDETAYILKDLSSDTDSQANYVIVEDDNELEAVSKVFEELLEDIDIK